MNPFYNFRDRFRFALGAVLGFLFGALLPALAGLAVLAIGVALHNGLDAGEIGGAILGALGTALVATVVGGAISWVRERMDDSTHFGEGFAKGGLTGLVVILCVLVLGGCAGCHEKLFPDL